MALMGECIFCGLWQAVFVWFVLTTWTSCDGTCDPDRGPEGSVACLLSAPHYSTHQWAVCLNSSYIKAVSAGQHACLDRSSTYCYYHCMTEVHGLNAGPVYSDCACRPGEAADDASSNSLQRRISLGSSLPASCARPAGDDCSWYRQCLEKMYPCEASSSPYAITFAEKMCLKFGKSFTTFSSKGQSWVDGVRRCLQKKMALFVYTRKSLTCEDIKTHAFASHSACYLHPSASAPSVCDLSFADLWKVLWTIKGAFIQASGEIVKGSLDVIKGCFFSRL